MGKVLTSLAALLLLITLLPACSGDGCIENRSSVPLAGFYGNSEGFPAITLDSLQITGIGAPGDSVLYRSGEKLSKVYLPMRSSSPSTSWCLAYKWSALDFPSLRDTITFRYSSHVYFASEQCGVIYRYRITGVDHTCHLIDSVAVTDSLVTNLDIERIKIIFRTADDDADEVRARSNALTPQLRL